MLAAKSLAEIDEIPDRLKIAKFQVDDTAYPQIAYSITRQEVEELKRNGTILADNSLARLLDGDPLVKLLYAVLWKNGDLKKVKHIVDGILAEPSETVADRTSGLVFYQFGRYLTKEDGEPIVDQHVLRAFGIFKAKGNRKEVDRLRKLSIVTKKDHKLIEDYRHWLRTALTPELRRVDNYAYHVDKVLFALGKAVKKGK